MDIIEELKNYTIILKKNNENKNFNEFISEMLHFNYTAINKCLNGDNISNENINSLIEILSEICMENYKNILKILEYIKLEGSTNFSSTYLEYLSEYCLNMFQVCDKLCKKYREVDSKNILSRFYRSVIKFTVKYIETIICMYNINQCHEFYGKIIIKILGIPNVTKEFDIIVFSAIMKNITPTLPLIEDQLLKDKILLTYTAAVYAIMQRTYDCIINTKEPEKVCSPIVISAIRYLFVTVWSESLGLQKTHYTNLIKVLAVIVQILIFNCTNNLTDNSINLVKIVVDLLKDIDKTSFLSLLIKEFLIMSEDIFPFILILIYLMKLYKIPSEQKFNTFNLIFESLNASPLSLNLILKIPIINENGENVNGEFSYFQDFLVKTVLVNLIENSNWLKIEKVLLKYLLCGNTTQFLFTSDIWILCLRKSGPQLIKSTLKFLLKILTNSKSFPSFRSISIHRICCFIEDIFAINSSLEFIGASDIKSFQDLNLYCYIFLYSQVFNKNHTSLFDKYFHGNQENSINYCVLYALIHNNTGVIPKLNLNKICNSIIKLNVNDRHVNTDSIVMISCILTRLSEPFMSSVISDFINSTNKMETIRGGQHGSIITFLTLCLINSTSTLSEHVFSQLVKYFKYETANFLILDDWQLSLYLLAQKIKVSCYFKELISEIPSCKDILRCYLQKHTYFDNEWSDYSIQVKRQKFIDSFIQLKLPNGLIYNQDDLKINDLMSIDLSINSVKETCKKIFNSRKELSSKNIDDIRQILRELNDLIKS